MSTVQKSLDELCIDTIRTLSIDAVQKANSGHPGLPLGAAPMAYVLWKRHLRHNPRDPKWPDRDRFVLSAGHGCMLLYSLLHLTGYDLTLDDLKAFRQWGSRTPGHPECHVTPGVEATTGPLGQGAANAVGMAMAERFLAGRYNRPGYELVNHRTFALVSDGDLMEGISGEASSLAGHLGLGKLVYLYDDNHVTLDGPTSWTFTEDVLRRYEAYGWQAIRVENGNTDLDAIDAALRTALGQTEKPTLIVVRTTIGYGSPHKAGTSKAHGSPLGPDEVAATKKALGWEWTEPFHEPEDALRHFREAVEKGVRMQAEWERRFEAYAAEYPAQAAEWRMVREGGLPEGWDRDLPRWKTGESLATRVASGKAINAIAPKIPWLIGGDADLSESTKTTIEGGGDFDPATGAGRNIHYGVREHAMAGIANGIAYHGGVASVRRDVLLLLGLHAAVRAPRGAERAARHLRVDARLDRPRRGRPDAPAGRAAHVAARDAAPRRDPAGRRQRDLRGVARGDRAPRTRRPRAVPPEPPRAGEDRPERRRLARRLRPRRGRRAARRG